MNYKPYKHLPPFKGMVLQNFPFIEEDFDAITNYQLLCKVVEYLKNVIANGLVMEENITNLYNEFIKLKSYVENYFDNLDVQEEINNKLDEMAIDGTLGNILNGKIYVSELNLSEFLSIKEDKSEIYAGAEHIVLQGLCYINGNILFALRNIYYNDNYVKLVEVKIDTKEILRSKYIELAHANSLFYRSDNNTVYVSACNQINETQTGTINDNRIFVLDYDTLNLVKTINVDNLPQDNRIRSVSYENGYIYGADVTTIFKIDEENEHIIETIELDTNLLNMNITNQTIKIHNNTFIGSFLTYLVVWDIFGHITKILNIPQNPNLRHIWEVEDTTFDENDNIIIGTNARLSTYIVDYETRFFITNLFTGNDNITSAGGYDSSNTSLYVDNTATNLIEDGTSARPFHELQKALTLAKNNVRGTDIHVKGTGYGHIYINNIQDLIIVFDSVENVNIDGMVINNSNVYMYQINSKFTINEMTINNSHVKIFMNDSNLSQINALTNRSVDITNSFVDISNVIINNNNIDEGMRIRRQSDVSLANVQFINESTHAISIENTSNCRFNDITWSATASSDTHHVKLTGASNLITEIFNPKSNAYTISGNSKLYPSFLDTQLNTNIYFGKVCDIPANHNMMKLKVKVAGSNGLFEYVDIPITSDEVNGNTLIKTEWINPISIRHGLLQIDTRNGELNITANKQFYITTSGTITEEDNTSTTPETSQNFASIRNVWFYTV